jgi:hypothetical protein
MTYAETIISDAPLVYYKLDDEFDTEEFVDAMGFENAVVTGTNFPNDGLPPYGSTGSQFLNGAYGVIPRIIEADFSIEFWISPSTNPSNPFDSWWSGLGIVDADAPYSQDDFGVSLTGGMSGARIMFGTGKTGEADVNIISNATVGINPPHHVVCTREKATSTIAIWVDGALDESETGYGHDQDLSSSTEITIGSVTTGRGVYDLVGGLDEVAIYDYVLSESQIEAHYLAGTTAPPSVPSQNNASKRPGFIPAF